MLISHISLFLFLFFTQPNGTEPARLSRQIEKLSKLANLPLFELGGTIRAQIRVDRTQGDDQEARYPNLRAIQIFLPYTCKQFRAKGRVIVAGSRTGAELSFTIDDDASSVISVTGRALEPGAWSEEIILRPNAPASRGWHTLKVRARAQESGSFLISFLLYAE